MNTTTKRFTVVLGIVMSAAMVVSLIAPLLSGQVGVADNLAETPRATLRPDPTNPPPPDIALIDFDSRYLHSSGLFTVAVPSGWEATTDSGSADELKAGFSNGAAQSIVDARIIKNPDGISTAEELSAFFSRDALNESWREYWNWDETSRKLDGDGEVVIDFNLSRSRVHFIARQRAWLQDGDIYSARVVTPENAPRELKYVLDGWAESIKRLDVYRGAAFEWNGYFDNAEKHLIRYPGGWQVVDAAPGAPATVIGDDATLVVEAADAALNNEEDARNWIETWRGGIEALSSESVEVAGASGYRVSYRMTTLDGAVESGLALMLRGADDRLHIANARASQLDTDLLGDDNASSLLRSVIDSFRLLPELDASTS